MLRKLYCAVPALCVACMAMPVTAQVYFDGGVANPGNWEDPVNWTGDSLPTTGVGRTLISAGDDAPLPGGVPSTSTVNLASDQTIDELRVGSRGGSDGTLNISAGTLTTQWVFAGFQGAEDGGGGATGRINLSGTGKLNALGNVSLFGADPGGNSSTVTVSDEAEFFGNETWVGLNQGAEGTVTQTGGRFQTGPHTDPNNVAELRIGGDSGGFGIYDISGGELEANDQGIYVGKNDDGIGSFRVAGNAASINTTFFTAGGFLDIPFDDNGTPDDGSDDFRTDPSQWTGVDSTGSATVLFTIDPVDGVSPVNASEDVFLGDQALLGVIGSVLPAMDIPLFNVGDELIGTFANVAEGAEFGGGTHSLTYAGGDGNDIVLQFIPEPTTALLAMLGVLGTGFRRR